MSWVVIVDMRIVLLFEAMMKYEILMKFQELDETLVKLCTLFYVDHRLPHTKYQSVRYDERELQI